MKDQLERYMKSVLIRKFGKKLKIEDEVYGADWRSVQLMDIDFVVTTVPLHIESEVHLFVYQQYFKSEI